MNASDARPAGSARSACLLPESFRSPAAQPAALAVSSRAITGTTLALGLSTAMLLPLHASAADIEMATVRVEERAIDPNPYAEPGVPYKAKYSGDERHTRPLAETPQTITVLTQEAIRDSGKSDLRDLLRAQPGITLGTGENGNAFGDRYIIRGQEARSDVFVDSLRDPGMTVRESFAVDQIEITKGPSSTFAGRGATGGAVNAITKQATTDTDFTKLSGGIGTDSYHRLTADVNRVLSDTLALRLNVMDAYQQVPDRDPADRKRFGFAASVNWKPAKDWIATLDYYHLRAKDKPDLGTWMIGGASGTPNPNSPVYLQDADFLKTEINTLTLNLGWQASQNVRVTNRTRYGTTENGFLTHDATGNAVRYIAPGVTVPTATLAAGGHSGWQEVSYFANQTNLFVNTELAGMKHELLFTLEYSDNRVINGTYNAWNTGAFNCRTGTTAGANNAYCILDANGNPLSNLGNLLGVTNVVKVPFGSVGAPLPAGATNGVTGTSAAALGLRTSDWRLKTTSLAVMDTVDLNSEWTAFAGLRYDRVSLADYVPAVNSANDVTWRLIDGLWNGHLGLTWKFRPDANVYATYSTSRNINGGESDVLTCDYGGICVPTRGAGGTQAVTIGGVNYTDGYTNAQRMAMFGQSKPVVTENVEFGSKWNVNGGKLLLTAAAFQTTKKDGMETINGAAYTDIGAINTYKARIQGLEFSLAGNILENVTAQAGYVTMRSEILASATAANVGRGITNFAPRSANLLLNWKVTPSISVGGNVIYQSAKISTRPDFATGIGLPSYTTLDLFASYKFDKNLTGRIHVNNATDAKAYLAGYPNTGMVYLGDARSTRVSLDYNF